MDCPACKSELRSMNVAGVSVDVCSYGCGGLWFDQGELQKFDEPHEEAGVSLLDIKPALGISMEYSKRHNCPKCAGSVLMRHFSSVKRQVEVDECPTCGGYWLDVGELRMIRSEYKTQDERRRAAQEYFREVFGERMETMRAESKERLNSARRIANIFRFLCPSYYIPGKQKWGAF